MAIQQNGFRSDERGTTVIEFAFLVLPMIAFLLGAVELGVYAFARAKVEGTLREASRMSATGNATFADIDAFVTANIDLIPNVTVSTEAKSYKSFTNVKQPEPITSDTAPLGGTPGSGDCYTDVNDNDQWDDDIGLSGVGGSEDIVYYGVSVSYEPLFTLTKNIIDESAMKIESNAVVKNEPYGNATTYESLEKCIP